MPSEQNHIDQAKHNISFLESFYPDYKFNDWSITVAFYTCIHIVEAAIHKKKKIIYLQKELTIEHSDQLFKEIAKINLPLPKNYSSSAFSNHTARGLIVNENFKEIAGYFDLLYGNSRTARYRQYNWNKNEVEFLVKPSLDAIIKWSNKNYSTDFVIKWK